MNPLVEKLPRFRNRTMASFVVDDFTAVTSEDTRDYARFRQWVQDAGLKGECSIILGMKRTPEGRALPLDPTFPQESRRAATHIDNYMEVMTHNFLYDFDRDCILNSGPHEGAWLLDRARPMHEYLNYFRHIAARAKAQDVAHVGLTLPGCGCPPCHDFYRAHHLAGQAPELNPGVYQALLALMADGTLPTSVCGLFIGNNPLGPADANVMAENGSLAVYDLPPAMAGDFMGRWDRNPNFLSADAYLTADGHSGRLPQLLAQQSRTLVIYGHWQSLRPGEIGFPVFQEVAARLEKHFADQILWMRPTEIIAYRHTDRHTEIRPSTDGRSFTLAIPFAPLHPLSVRILNAPNPRLRTPSGEILHPDPSPAAPIFNLTVENGVYQILT